MRASAGGTDDQLGRERPAPGGRVPAGDRVDHQPGSCGAEFLERLTARELGACGWDVRALPGAPHDMRIRVPDRLATLLDDVLRT